MLDALRRKRLELNGALALAHNGPTSQPSEGAAGTAIPEAIEAFLNHARVHSPGKPSTWQSYRVALAHFARLLGGRRCVEAVTRAEIERYESLRLAERSHYGRTVQPATVNFELEVLRTFFNFLVRELGLALQNPCAHFKLLRDPAPRPTGSGSFAVSVRPTHLVRVRGSW